MISSDVIEEVRRLVDPVILVGSRVKLWKAGTSYAGLCPFHEEREGSFRLYPQDKRFVCFGCGARGDIFEFLQRAEGKPFPVVVRELAASVGVVVEREQLSAEERRARAERAALLAACEAAARHWQKNLWKPRGEEARGYLARRGIGEATARVYRLGYARREWHDLEHALRGGKIPVALQRDAGVLAVHEAPEKPKRYYDRFRHRIVFPISDAEGRVIGFGGRALGADRGAKYLNGPETPLYKKSRVLYGLHEARDVIRRTGKAVLVEGYFDVLALHQMGLCAVVAAGGTALSSEQVELLVSNGCRELVLLFDGDEAGAAAPARAARVLLEANLTAVVARLPAAPDGRSDPDALVVRSGKRGVEEVLAGARPLTEFIIDDAVRCHAEGLGTLASVEHKLSVLRSLTPFVLAVPHGLARSAFERTVARRLGIDIGPLRQEFQRVEREPRAGGQP